MSAPPRPPLGVVLVGAGHLGSYHLDKILASPTAELVAVVEPDAGRRARAAAKVRSACADAADAVQFSASLAQLAPQLPTATARRPRTLAAIVAAPTPLHPPLALDCLARGWHVLVEKPLAATSQACLAMVEAAKRRNLVLQVGHLERFNPAVRAVLPLLAQARYVVCERLGPFTGRSAEVDVVLDLMVHDLDLVATALGQAVTEVRAVGVPVLTDAVDMASARLSFANGAVAQLSAGRVSLEPCRKLRFFTANRYVSVDFLRNEVKVMRRDPPLPGSPWPQVKAEPLWVQGEAKLAASAKNGAATPSDPASTQAMAPADALAAQDEAFFAAALRGHGAEVDGEAGLRAVRLVEAVKAAFQPWSGEAATLATVGAEGLQASH